MRPALFYFLYGSQKFYGLVLFHPSAFVAFQGKIFPLFPLFPRQSKAKFMMKIEKESRVACQGPLRAQCLGSNQVDAMPPFQWLTFDSEMTIANV